jgi:hypothetical protein
VNNPQVLDQPQVYLQPAAQYHAQMFSQAQDNQQPVEQHTYEHHVDQPHPQVLNQPQVYQQPLEQVYPHETGKLQAPYEHAHEQDQEYQQLLEDF